MRPETRFRTTSYAIRHTLVEKNFHMNTLEYAIGFYLLSIHLVSAQTGTVTFTILNIPDNISSITISKYDYETHKMLELNTQKGISVGQLVSFYDTLSEPSIYLFTTNSDAELRIAVEKPGSVDIHLSGEKNVTSQVAVKSDFAGEIQN